MKLFNTLSKAKEEFVPVDKKEVRLYTCGPTVYNFAHIGNFRTYIFEDLLRRWLKHQGFKVKQVMNLTDVEDKIIRDAQKEGISLKEFTERYTEAFFEDLQMLNVERVEFYPKATEEIKAMEALITCLLDKGIAYKTEDGIYFSISKFKEYGKLAHIDVKKLQAGASGLVKADEYEKENVADFALWKFWDPQDRDVFWETKWGKGRPGWHIECSAMSAKYLTSAIKDSTFIPGGFTTMDIHAGGVDLVFPHHENEIAQSEGCVNKPFAKYWLHSEHLLVDNKKMSKSLKNFYTVRDILSKGYHPLALRYLLLSVHYRQKLNFTFEALEGAATAVQRLNDFVKRLGEVTASKGESVYAIIEKARQQFEQSLDDDLEISPALAAIFELMTQVNKLLDAGKLSKADAKAVGKFMHEVDTVLGVLEQEEAIPKELAVLLKERESARESEQWKRADELRDELKKHNIAVEDTPNGQRWKRLI